jgi:conjugative relaxase-like TrwC/TraI family protein
VAVLSVAKLSLGQEAYYEQQVAAGVDDYYAGRGESPGLWAGRGAGELGLLGAVEEGDLGTLLRGVDPGGGQRLRSPVKARTITTRRLDVETGEWRDAPKRLAPVSGFDLVFSCPKSVSLVHALSDDPGVRRAVSEAHELAWQAALGYLEREACVIRRGRGGAIREPGEGFVAAAFRHRTSRAQDPHLHTHVIVANMTRSSDGEWRALDGAAILKTYRLAAGYLYEACLRDELTHRLGVRWRPPVNGMAELDGVPEGAVRAFSTRRQALVAHMRALGTEGFAAARVAALATREAKEPIDLPRLREEWKARAAEHSLGRLELSSMIADPSVGRTGPDHRQIAAGLLAPDGLTSKRSTFTMPDLVCAVAGSLQAGDTVEGVLETAAKISRLAGVEVIDAGGVAGRPARYTTRELLRVERDAIRIARDGRSAGAPSPDAATLERALARSAPALTNEQRLVVREASAASDRVVCVVGVAGAGKTTALRALADAFHTSGVSVLGAAPSGRAADELARATGIATSTLHRLLLDATHAHGLPNGSVLVIDEAGMAETRVLAPLLRVADRAGGKVILVGDPAQLPAVGAGGLYTALCERLGAVTLTENRRQHDLSERQALAQLRDGDPEPYLTHAASRGRFHLDSDAITAKHRLLDDWWQAAQTDPVGAVMLAYRRDDVRDLNHAAHARMLTTGRLGTAALIHGEREFRVGERVVCRRNDPRLGVRNGTRGTITDIDESTQTLILRTDAGSLQSLPGGYTVRHLDHAYALTGHAAQGATVERAFVLLPKTGNLREWFYSVCSRAKAETRLYGAESHSDGEAHGPKPDSPHESWRAALALSASSAERLALDQVDRADLGARTAQARPERRRAREPAGTEAEPTEVDAKLDGRGLPPRLRRSDSSAQVAPWRSAPQVGDCVPALDRSPARTTALTRTQRCSPPPSSHRRFRNAQDAIDRGLDM